MPTALVIGAGLAGLTVARELQTHGFRVTVFEKSSRVGGKAGSLPGTGPHACPGVLYEHGYHIFPPWYLNMRKIVRDVGTRLIDFNRWHYLLPMAEGRKRLTTMQIPTSLASLAGLASAWSVVSQSPIPIPDTLLYFYFVLDMVGQPLSRKSILDQVSRIGVMRNRWYMTRRLPELEDENILKASAIPAYDMSAYTAKILSSYWLRLRRPFLSILPDNLQTALIDPYHRQVVSSGVAIRLGHEVTALRCDGGPYVRSVTVHGPHGRIATKRADVFVVATPLDVTPTLIEREVYDRDTTLGRIQHLRAAPMAALHLTLRHKRTDLPREFVFFRGGEYGLSFIDHSQHWPLPNARTHTTLSFISSNFAPLQSMSRNEQYGALMTEIENYLAIDPARDVQYWELHPNTDFKLFINTIGAWGDRPRVSCGIPNLFFAGDWVKNRIDLATMEGAVFSALHAAHEIGERYRHATGVRVPPGPLLAPRYNPALVRLVVRLLAPTAAAFYAAARLNDWLFGSTGE